jgi:hypothetical protein
LVDDHVSEEIEKNIPKVVGVDDLKYETVVFEKTLGFRLVN